MSVAQCSTAKLQGAAEAPLSFLWVGGIAYAAQNKMNTCRSINQFAYIKSYMSARVCVFHQSAVCVWSDLHAMLTSKTSSTHIRFKLHSFGATASVCVCGYANAVGRIARWCSRQNEREDETHGHKRRDRGVAMGDRDARARWCTISEIINLRRRCDALIRWLGASMPPPLCWPSTFTCMHENGCECVSVCVCWCNDPNELNFMDANLWSM